MFFIRIISKQSVLIMPMVIPLNMKGFNMPTFIYPTTASVPSFDSLLQKMMPHFQCYAKRLMRRRGSRRFDFDDVIQELTGFALVMYRSLIRRNKEVFYTPLMKFAIMRYREGRRFAGTNTLDVLSEQAQELGRCDTCQLSEFDDDADTWDFMQDRRQPHVVDAVQVSMDYETWYRRLMPRDQKIVADLSFGHTTGDVAKKYGVSAGLISQYRKRYYKDWNDFISDPV